MFANIVRAVTDCLRQAPSIGRLPWSDTPSDGLDLVATGGR